MSDQKPAIASLQPIVLPDNRRVTLEMVVNNLPPATANINFFMPDMSGSPPPRPPKPDPDTPSPYPDVELSILNSRRQPVASLFIVEHKETHTSLTLHIPTPDVAEQYTARAEIIYQDQTLDVAEMPFTLNPVE